MAISTPVSCIISGFQSLFIKLQQLEQQHLSKKLIFTTTIATIPHSNFKQRKYYSLSMMIKQYFINKVFQYERRKDPVMLPKTRSAFGDTSQQYHWVNKRREGMREK